VTVKLTQLETLPFTANRCYCQYRIGDELGTTDMDAMGEIASRGPVDLNHIGIHTVHNASEELLKTMSSGELEVEIYACPCVADDFEPDNYLLDTNNLPLRRRYGFELAAPSPPIGGTDRAVFPPAPPRGSGGTDGVEGCVMEGQKTRAVIDIDAAEARAKQIMLDVNLSKELRETQAKLVECETKLAASEAKLFSYSPEPVGSADDELAEYQQKLKAKDIELQAWRDEVDSQIDKYDALLKLHQETEEHLKQANEIMAQHAEALALPRDDGSDDGSDDGFDFDAHEKPRRKVELQVPRGGSWRRGSHHVVGMDGIEEELEISISSDGSFSLPVTPRSSSNGSLTGGSLSPGRSSRSAATTNHAASTASSRSAARGGASASRASTSTIRNTKRVTNEKPQASKKALQSFEEKQAEKRRLKLERQRAAEAASKARRDAGLEEAKRKRAEAAKRRMLERGQAPR